MGAANYTSVQRCINATCDVCVGRLVAKVLHVNNHWGLPTDKQLSHSKIERIALHRHVCILLHSAKGVQVLQLITM